MLQPPRTLDPDGLYARLGLEPAATQPQIAKSFRAQARILHPDVPRTGNADAFVALRRAYDVLSDPTRRAEYDQRAAAQHTQASWAAQPAGTQDWRAWPAQAAGAPAAQDLGDAIPDDAIPDDAIPLDEAVWPNPIKIDPVPARAPRFSDLPLPVWLGMGALLAFGTFEAVIHLSAATREPDVSIRPNAPAVAPLSPSAQRAVLYGPTPLNLAGTPNAYVTPSGSPAVLWRLDPARHALVPMAELPPFSTMQAVQVIRQPGLLEVLVTDAQHGFVSSNHVAPGDRLAARRAYCSYNAGPVPQDGEVLEKRASGPATLTIDNRGVQPAVVKLRDPSGHVALSIFVAPNGHSDLAGVPDGVYQPEFAAGELWSRACNGFTSATQVGRLAQPVRLPGDTQVIIAPDGDGPRWTAMPEQDFERE